MKVLYNPKKFNGAPCVPVTDIFFYNRYTLGVNQMAQFEDQVGDYLLKKFGFLKEIKPEDIPKVKLEMEAKEFVCEFCKEEFATEQQLQGHKNGKHKLSKENQELLESIPVAAPVERVGRGPRSKMLSPDEVEGIPADGKKDRDGVEWYGEGATEDTLTDMRPRVPGSTRGVFGAS